MQEKARQKQDTHGFNTRPIMKQLLRVLVATALLRTRFCSRWIVWRWATAAPGASTGRGNTAGTAMVRRERRIVVRMCWLRRGCGCRIRVRVETNCFSFTNQRTLIGVNSGVASHVAEYAETSSTSWVGARKRCRKLFSVIDGHKASYLRFSPVWLLRWIYRALI